MAGLVMTVLTVGLVSWQGNHYPVSGPETFSRRSMPASGCAGRSGAVTGVVSLAVTDDSSEAEHSMTEQKRPVLTLSGKRKGRRLSAAGKPSSMSHATKVEGEKAEAGGESSPGSELAAKKAQARQALSIYLNLPHWMRP